MIIKILKRELCQRGQESWRLEKEGPTYVQLESQKEIQLESQKERTEIRKDNIEEIMAENFPELTKKPKFTVEGDTIGSFNSYLLCAYCMPDTF